ncbi:trk system potassium uptake protein TrkA [Salinibacter ruber]|uniref:Trk system potassium transporter TrkA n=1 Tax=Salinibacter ruber TaxID=146919 RepID=UPI0021695338|nr:Trk system potassium transporter TrkA [Salinibacter ruber]MCS3632146.1 trk system potassium uptake protein TrkA [Salinibacter ruber]
MKVLIVGAGQVGQTVAQELAPDHAVVAIDRRYEALEQVPGAARVVQGDGVELDVLQEGDVEEADILIACTDDDRTNILICSTAKLEGDPFAIARVAHTQFLDTWHHSRKAFGVDLMVGRSSLTARSVARLVGFQSAEETAFEERFFAGGRIEMAEFEIESESPLAGKTVEHADRFEGVTFASLFRDGEMMIPEGTTRLAVGDRLVVMGNPKDVKAFGIQLNPSTAEEDVNRIVVLGGGEIGAQTAQVLQQRGLSVTLVERDPGRAERVAETLSNTMVLQSDATNRAFWKTERLDRADLCIVALRPDERVLLAGLLAKQLGVPRVFGVIRERQYVGLGEMSALDGVVHPREETAAYISRHVLESYADSVARIEHERAEVFETTLSTEGRLTDRRIEEGVPDLPGPCTVGTVLREGRVLVPRGNTLLRTGDRVVVIAHAEHAEAIADML